MRIAIGSDHAGFFLKKDLSAYVYQLGHEVVDVGAHGAGAVDYPDYADAVGRALLDGRAERGILICGSGVGASAAANKLPGIRAGLCHDTYSAHQGVEHDDMNVLVLGARVIGTQLAQELVSVYLRAAFSGEERYRRRLQKLRALEERYRGPSRRGGTLVEQSNSITRARYEAVLFDLDGVITNASAIHTSCWKQMFDEYLKRWSEKNGAVFLPFDVARDYSMYVDGKPQYQGVREFLKSRGIILPEGRPKDPPATESVCGLGNRKNELVNSAIAASGVDALPGSIAFIKFLRHLGISTAVVTATQNCRAILQAAKIEELFDARVDGDVLVENGLVGKPAPDSLLYAATILEVTPARAVVVENAIAGVKAGAEGGFGLVIGLARQGNAHELKANGAHLVVRDLADLLESKTTEVA